MTKLRIMSDLHLEFGQFDMEPAGEDILVLAGDIGVRTEGAIWALQQSERLGVPVVMIAGNHEFYDGRHPRGDMETVYRELHEIADKSGGSLRFLQNETAVVAGVRFVGTTLWTDFDLYGNPLQSMMNASKGMNDFRLIWQTGTNDFSPRDSVTEHETSKKCIGEAISRHTFLDKLVPMPFVVVTHHAPSLASVTPYWQTHGKALNPAFASNMDHIVAASDADLWVHGHMHNSLDYMIGNTRVLCNPRGYVGHEINQDFDAALIVEV